MLHIKTILHPTDFSERSDSAFRLACSLTRDYGARLVVVHVSIPPVVVYGEGVVPLSPEESEAMREGLRERLHQLLPRDPMVRIEHRLAEGDAPTEILRLARETNSDMIVMGTHGRTGFSRLLMGSVAEQVVRKAACPVVTVKTPLAEALLEEESGYKTADQAAELANA